MSLPDPRAPRRRAARQPQPPPRGAHASEALEKLTRETREAVRGLETATGGIAGLDDEAGVAFEPVTGLGGELPKAVAGAFSHELVKRVREAPAPVFVGLPVIGTWPRAGMPLVN